MNIEHASVEETRYQLWNPLALPKDCVERIQTFHTNCLTPTGLLQEKERFLRELPLAHKRLRNAFLTRDGKRIKPNVLPPTLAPKLTFGLRKEGETLRGELGENIFPDLRNSHLFTNYKSPESAQEKIIKSLSFWWPICPITNQRMKYLGWIDAGWTYTIIHMATSWYHWSERISPLGKQKESSARLHFFSGAQGEFTSFAKNCHVEVEYFYQGKAYENLIDLNLYQDIFAKFQEKHPILTEPAIRVADTQLGEPEFGFDPVLIPKNNGSGEFFLPWKDGRPSPAFTLFGEPRGQQTPKRPICPNRLPRLRALSPVINFNDPVEDLSYQIYSDLINDDPHNSAFAEGSCT